MPSPIPSPPPLASATLSGLVSTVAQSFAGDKTFLGKLLMSGNALGLAPFTTAGRPAFGANTGAIIFNTDTGKVQFSDGTGWFTLDSTAGSFVQKTGDSMSGALTITGAGMFVDSANNTLVVDSSTHRVGIKVGSPTVELDVSGSQKLTGTLDMFSATANTKIKVFNDGTRVVGIGYQANDYRFHVFDSSDKFSWRIGAAAASAMELLGNGNHTVDAANNTFIVDAVNHRVGIGTLTPSQPLTVNGIIFSSSGGVRFPDNSTQTSAFVPSSYVQKIGDSMSGLLSNTAGIDIDSGTHTLFVDSTNHRVGIGRNDPARKLDVKFALAADHLVQIQNSDVAGSSGIAFMDNGAVERFRIGYANPSWAAAPLADLCFIQTDGNKDLIIAHAGTLAHRFLTTGMVKFDQADNTLVVDAVNNRVGIGTATPTSGYALDIDQSDTGKLIRLHNTSTTGFSGIDYVSTAGTIVGSLGVAGSGVTSLANNFSLDIIGGNTFHFRSGTTLLTSVVGNTGNWTFDETDNVLFIDAQNNRVSVNTNVNASTVANIGVPNFLVDSAGASSAIVIRGDGTHRKGFTSHDQTNNRSWTWDHNTSANNNRFELWYWNGAAESRILTATTNGRLGINNVTPSVELDVTGSAQFSGGLTVDTNSLLVDNAQHSVGIGTSPAAGNKLDVAGIIHSSATDVTPAVGTGITVNYIGNQRLGYYKITIANTAWTAAATTQDITIATLPAKARVVGVMLDTTVAYTGTGATSYTLRLGKTAGGQEYMLDHDVKTAVVTKGLSDADLGASLSRANAIQGGDLPSWTATTNISARLTSNVNISNITAGSTTYYLTVEFM